MRHDAYKVIKHCNLCGAPVLYPIWWMAHHKKIKVVSDKPNPDGSIKFKFIEKEKLGIPRYEIPEIPTCRHITQKERVSELR